MVYMKAAPWLQLWFRRALYACFCSPMSIFLSSLSYLASWTWRVKFLLCASLCSYSGRVLLAIRIRVQGLVFAGVVGQVFAPRTQYPNESYLGSRSETWDSLKLAPFLRPLPGRWSRDADSQRIGFQFGEFAANLFGMLIRCEIAVKYTALRIPCEFGL